MRRLRYALLGLPALLARKTVHSERRHPARMAARLLTAKRKGATMLRGSLLTGVLLGSLIGSVVAAAVVTGITERVLDSGSTGGAEAAALVPGPRA